jgi:large repetitive protein
MGKNSTLRVVMPTTRSTSGTKRARGIVPVLGLLVLAAACIVAPSAQASPRAAAAVAASVGNYSAGADGALVDLTAGSPAIGSPLGAIPTVANLRLTHAEAAANSQGGVGTDAATRSYARAANLDPLAVLEQINLSNLLSEIAQSAPPDNAAPATKQLLAVPAAPLLTASVSDASALAHWAGDGVCVAADTPLAQSFNRTAQVDVLPALPAPISGSLLSVNAAQQGASFTQSTLSLPSIVVPGKTDPRAVQAEQVTHAAGVSLFGVNIDVGAVDPVLTARATGLAGGATASYTAPIVTINGNQVIGQTDISALIAQLNPVLAPLLTGLAPVMTVTISVPSEADVVAGANLAADGTSASVDSYILRVTVAVPALQLTVADVALGPMHADAAAPAGGIDCGTAENPITVTKNASKTTVQPGETFHYTITVGNTSPTCTLTNVKVTDELTGPAGSEITGTTPPADSAVWPTVTWNNIGNIPPGGSVELSIAIKVPVSAQADQTYSDTATATGTCDGTQYTKPFTLKDIPKVVLGLLPRTGGESSLLLIGAVAMLGAALGLRRLRRV